ncbi:MAG: hypothetical protein ACTTKC_04945 [Treponema sp.]|uniref:hypothetical protein n=1 Tax=Treponema sp. TaxID=166 RepID=UPI003FA213A1
MKTLLISESRDILTAYADFFKSMGYENLCYRWLLKAMDNLEEIQPDVVFINASDYPRHWKTIVQHIRASGFCNPVVLIAAEYLDEDDQAKARFLGIYCITSSIDTEETRQKIRTQLNCAQCENPPEQNVAPEPQLEPETASCSESEKESSYDFENIVEQPEKAEVTVPPVTAEAAAKTESEPVMTITSTDIPVEDAEVSLNQSELASLTESVSEQQSIFIDKDEMQNTETQAFSEPELSPKLEILSKQEPAAAPLEELFEAPAKIIEKAKTEKPVIEKTEEQSVPQEASATFTFIHPVSKIEITGPLLKYEHPLLFFRPYNKTEGNRLRLGKRATGIINRGGEILNVSVQVQGLDGDIAELCILNRFYN